MAKAAAKSPELCPTCGQKMPPALGAKERLYRKYATKKGYSQARIARELGVSDQVIGFLFSGRQGTGNRYQGLKPIGGKEPLALRVSRLLGIPDTEFRKAYVEDQLEEQAEQLNILLAPRSRRRGAKNSCSPHMRRRQQLHVEAVAEKSDLPLIAAVAG